MRITLDEAIREVRISYLQEENDELKALLREAIMYVKAVAVTSTTGEGTRFLERIQSALRGAPIRDEEKKE